MAAELVVVVATPAGAELRLEWRPQAIEALGPSAPPDGELWSMSGDPGWEQVECLRVLSGRIEDGRMLGIAALRPADSAGHGDEEVTGALLDDQGAHALEEVLLSTELGPDAAVRRVGLELYRQESEMPLRVAGDATGATTEVDDGVRRTRVSLELRLAGKGGPGLLEILARA